MKPGEKHMLRKRFEGDLDVYRHIAGRHDQLVSDVLKLGRIGMTGKQKYELRRTRAEFMAAIREQEDVSAFGRFLETHFEKGRRALTKNQEGLDELNRIIRLVRIIQRGNGKPTLDRHAIDAIALLGFMANEKKPEPEKRA